MTSSALPSSVPNTEQPSVKVDIVDATRDFVQSLSLAGANVFSSKLDHITRVTNLAKALGKRVSELNPSVIADMVLLEVCSLLHEIIPIEDPQISPPIMASLIKRIGPDRSGAIYAVVRSALGALPIEGWEASLLHDAHLLDTMGAIGLHQAFRSAGSEAGRRALEIALGALARARSGRSMMVTQVGKDVADERLSYMEQYVARLAEENEGLS